MRPLHKQDKVNKIYDPACDSGSLLLQAKKHFDAHIVEDGFFGQEINLAILRQYGFEPDQKGRNKRL